MNAAKERMKAIQEYNGRAKLHHALLLICTTPSPYTVSLSTTSDPNDYTLRQASPNTTPSLQTARVMNQELGRTSSINRTLTGRFVNSGCQYYGPNDEDQYYGDQPQSMSPESDTKCLLGGIVSPVYEKAHGVQTAFQGVAALATASTGHWPGANASLPLAQPPTAQQARSSSPAYYTSPPASTSQLRRPTVARPSRASATSPPQQPANTRQITSRAQPLQVTAYNTASLRSRSSGTATTPPTSGYDQQRPRFYRGAGPS
nr:hypothetical protein B0A51_12676 [Rachicladosporium sp. CCFEE 5018]